LRVLVLESQTPFVHGGAEILARALLAALRGHGYQAELVSIPFRDSPRDELLAHAAAWRLIDVTRALDQPIDAVIATKFPTYFVRHPAKVAWLVHQHRAAYELCGTPFSDFEHTERDVGLRKRLLEQDTAMLRECRGLFSIARTVSARLQKYNQLTATPLYHPPRLAASIRSGAYGDYFVLVSRLEKVKRIDLAIEAMAHAGRSARLVVAGDGSERAALAARIEALGLGQRVRLAGRVGDAELIELLAGARALLFTPFEEDYGYVTLEAFLARKPVITTTDSGGPLEFVEDGVNGIVAAPTPAAVGATVARLAANAAEAARLGEAGFARARVISWDGVVEQLMAAARGGAAAAHLR
jgi:glycosyltransferase involved in cell wall biosynthesis